MSHSDTGKHQILFLDTVHPVLWDRLSENGFICVAGYDFKREDVLAMLPEFFGVVIRSRLTIDREFLDRATSLQFIARSGSGLENIDTAYANECGVEVISSPEGNRDAVGEHVIGMLLMLLNHLHRADAQVRNGLWQREANRGIELSGKTFSLIGYGTMGSAVAEKLQGFGCRVLAHDKYKTGFGKNGITEATLDQVYLESDIVSLHLPLSTETFHYAGGAFFHSFARPIWFINTSRGAHVDSTALIHALDEGLVRGACLDVLEMEKESLEGLVADRDPDTLHQLLSHERILFSPHVAGWTTESYQKLSAVLADKILAWHGI